VKLAALAVLALCVRVAAAEPEPDVAATAFRDALAREDIGALEQLGAQRPVTMWTDDAWAEAARLAVRANDFARARADLEQVIAIGTDAQLVRRARAELARIASFAGAGGEWTEVAAEHERLEPALHTPGDPRPALAKLEALVRAHPGYPRAATLMIAIAQTWEREGEGDRALQWLHEATRAAALPADKQHAQAELVRGLVRTGHLGEAETELAELARSASPVLVASLHQQLARAKLRRTLRYVMWTVLAVLAALAAFVLRRRAGSWRAALRRLARPPTETLFLVPIGAVICAIAFTGNPLIARTVLAIVVAGIVTSWLSGALLAAGPRLRLRGLLLHASLAIVAIVASVYLAVDRGHVIDFIIETWHAGPER
jgi:hypothetical protein